MTRVSLKRYIFAESILYRIYIARIRTTTNRAPFQEGFDRAGRDSARVCRVTPSLTIQPCKKQIARARDPVETRSPGYYYTGVDSNSYARARRLPRAVSCDTTALRDRDPRGKNPTNLIPGWLAGWLAGHSCNDPRKRNPEGTREIVDRFGKWTDICFAWELNINRGKLRECPCSDADAMPATIDICEIVQNRFRRGPFRWKFLPFFPTPPVFFPPAYLR